MLKDLDLEAYKTHPRILEIRLILLYDMFEREFGMASTQRIFEQFIKMFKCNRAPIMAVIGKRFQVKKGSRNSKKRLWRQEVIFMGLCYGETPYKMAKDFLNLHPQNLYSQKAIYDPNEFVTDEWLDKLDRDVINSYENYSRLEISRLLDGIDSLSTVLVVWKGGK